MNADPRRRLLITGTDTGVGKTVVGAAIARTLGPDVVYVKAAQTGTLQGDDDAGDVARLANVPTAIGVAFGPPLAPAVAARLANVEVTRDDLLDAVSRAEADHSDAHLIVEGSGGVLVELGTDGTTAADLAAELQLEVVVVTRPGLGTLNHTALTIEAIARRDLDLAGVVIASWPEHPDIAASTNAHQLDRLAQGRMIGALPDLPEISAEVLRDARTWIGPELGGQWDREEWLEKWK